MERGDTFSNTQDLAPLSVSLLYYKKTKYAFFAIETPHHINFLELNDTYKALVNYWPDLEILAKDIFAEQLNTGFCGFNIHIPLLNGKYKVYDTFQRILNSSETAFGKSIFVNDNIANILQDMRNDEQIVSGEDILILDSCL